MRLLSLAELQAVFQMPQELVCAGQVMKFLAADVALVMQFLQGKQRASGAEPRLASAVNPLQALHQKLNIADAATIKSLDKYRDMLGELTDPRKTSEARAQQLLHTAKPIRSL